MPSREPSREPEEPARAIHGGNLDALLIALRQRIAARRGAGLSVAAEEGAYHRAVLFNDVGAWDRALAEARKGLG